MTKILLLDIDGVLIDDTDIFYDELKSIHGLSKHEFMEFYTQDYPNTWLDKDDLKEVLEKWIKKWNLDINVENFVNLWFKSEDRPNKEMIEHVKSHENVYLATTQEKHRMKYILEDMKFREFTKDAFASFMFGNEKPEFSFYEKCYEKLLLNHPQLKKEDVIFFDDKQKNVDGANDFGFDSHLFTSFKKFKKILDDKFKR